MLNKKQIDHRCLWLTALLVGALGYPLSAQEAAPETPIQEAAPETPIDEASSKTAPSSTNDINTDQSTPEPPIENAATAQPSLKYEPSERISEDSSVSFPVDI